MSYDEQPVVQSECEPSHNRLTFDFEQMGPEAAAAMIGALAIAEQAHQDGNENDAPDPYDWLLDRAARDLKRVADESDEALGIYATLTSDLTAEIAVSIAAGMAPGLLRRNLDKPDVRLQVVGPLLAAMHSERGVGGEMARHTLEQLVYVDWLDEPTVRFINKHLPADSQRW